MISKGVQELEQPLFETRRERGRTVTVEKRNEGVPTGRLERRLTAGLGSEQRRKRGEFDCEDRGRRGMGFSRRCKGQLKAANGRRSRRGNMKGESRAHPKSHGEGEKKDGASPGSRSPRRENRNRKGMRRDIARNTSRKKRTFRKSRRCSGWV